MERVEHIYTLAVFSMTRSWKYELHVLRRSQGYLLAQRATSDAEELVLITQIHADWLRTHFSMEPEEYDDVQLWLDRKCGHP